MITFARGTLSGDVQGPKKLRASELIPRAIPPGKQIPYKLRSDGNELKKLSTLWVDAFNAYLDRTPIVVVLARMAVAHILGDLECVLFLNPVTREEYDRVYDDIADCVARSSRGLVQHGNFLEILYGLMQPVVDPARNYAIWMMRSLAWDLYQQRLRLSQR